MAERARAVATSLLLLFGLAGGLAGQVGGRVVDAATGDPVAGAEIVASGDAVVAVTGPDGRWRASTVPAGAVLRVRHLGYATADVRPTGREGAVVRLERRPVDLGAIVVTAGRRLQRLADAVVATEVVSVRDIRESGASDVASVLTERTGVELSGGHPNGAGVMLQGLDAERLLVLVDGQPFIGRLSGQVDLSRLPADMVERVEVVKGPQSTLYGSDAMGGVVNVITRAADGRPWSASVRAVAGGAGRREGGGTVAASDGPWSGLLQVGRRDIGVAPGIAEPAGALARRWDGSFRASFAADTGRRAELSGFVLDERQRWRSGPLYQFADNVQWGARAAADAVIGAHRLQPTLFASEFTHLSRAGTADEPAAGTGDRETQRLLQGALVYATRVARADVDAGLEVREEAIRSGRVQGGELDIGSVSAYAQASLPVGGTTVVPGVRVTGSRAWGTHVKPRMAALLRVTPALALRASVGSGYRAPQFKELAMQFLNIGPGFGYAVRGNADLRPETSRNVTVGAEWSGERVYLRAQAFANELDDFIETQLEGDSAGIQLYTYENIASGETRGLELEAATTWRGLRVEAGYAFLRTEGGDGLPLLGRPEHSARAALSYVRASGLRLSLTALHTGSTPVARTDAGVSSRTAFTRFDARIAHALPGGLEIAVGADNVFDARPERWPGFTGRHLYASLAWNAGAR